MKKICIVLLIVFTFTSLFPFTSSAETLDLNVPSALLMDQTTGKVLYEHNADEKRAPASVTKIMTMLLIMEALEANKLSLADLVTVTSEAASMGGSQVYLKEGENMTVEEMLKCIAVVSANDCCVAMAEAISGSLPSFINAMNTRANELGMSNTHFNSCTGLDTEEHYTTARDIAIMSRELMKHPQITQYTTIWMDTVRNGEFSLSNTNKLVRFYDGATGLKTGFTSSAGYCLSATATRDSLSLIAVVLGGETSNQRFEDAKTLLNYGFSQYSLYKEPLPSPAAVSVIKGMQDTVQPVLMEVPSFLIPKGTAKDITYTITLPENVLAPIEENQKLGTVTYSLNGEVLGTFNLIAKNEVPRITFSHLFSKFIRYFFTV